MNATTATPQPLQQRVVLGIAIVTEGHDLLAFESIAGGPDIPESTLAEQVALIATSYKDQGATSTFTTHCYPLGRSIPPSFDGSLFSAIRGALQNSGVEYTEHIVVGGSEERRFSNHCNFASASREKET